MSPSRQSRPRVCTFQNGLDRRALVHHRDAVVDRDPFNRHDAVAAVRQHRARHRLETGFRIVQSQRWQARGLRACNR